ncbi:MAG: hypothetical protein KAR16_03325 [Bacteroidales bacterium]|nr:hypothetical protein [Bacteroidales bacterium]
MRFDTPFKVIIILFAISSCTKGDDDFIIVSSLDQIQGLWEWESTCGGLIFTCGYPSDSNFQSIEFTSDHYFVEKHNDTLYFSAPYAISKTNNTDGRLIIYEVGTSDTLSNRPINLVDNRLIISAGELAFSYKKIK